MCCRFAREKRLRLWKDYVPSAPVVPIQNKEFTGKVSVLGRHLHGSAKLSVNIRAIGEY